MSEQRFRHWITEHVWRLSRALFILTGMVIWLAQDGFQGTDWLILLCGLGAGICDQLHGFICNRIERFMRWKEDFNNWE